MHVRQLNNTDNNGREANLQREIVQLKRDLSRSKACMRAFLSEIDNIQCLKHAIYEDDIVYAQQLWDEINSDDQQSLMISPRAGGCFSTQERAIIASFWKEVGI